MQIMFDRRFDSILDYSQLLCERWTAVTLCNGKEIGQLTSERSATLGEGDWGKRQE